MQKNNIKKLLAIAACVTLTGGINTSAQAADPPGDAVYQNLKKYESGTHYANGVYGTIGGTYDAKGSDIWTAGNSDSISIYITKDSSAILNIHDYGSSTLTNALIVATGIESSAKINVIDGTFTIASPSFLDRGVTIDVQKDGTMSIVGGEVILDTKDKNEGVIELSGGTLTLDSYNGKNTQTGVYAQSGGTATILGTGFNLDNDRDIITGGDVIIGQNAASGQLEVSKGYIGSGANLEINENSSLKVSGGNVTIDSGDVYIGKVDLTGGQLDLSNASKTQNATFTQSGGDLIITGSSFDLNNSNDKISSGDVYIGDGSNSGTLAVTEGTIDTKANINILSGSDLGVTGGTVTLDNKDIIDGDLWISDGSLTLNSVEKSTSSTFEQTGGTTNIKGDSFVLNNSGDIIENGNLNIGDSSAAGTLTIKGGSILSNADVNLEGGSTLDIQSGSVSLDSKDTLAGSLKLEGGNLNLDNVGTANINQSSGNINVTGNSLTLNSQSNLDGGKLNIGNGSTAATVTISAGNITRNEDIILNEKGNLVISGTSNVTVDFGDTWNGNIKNNGGNLNLEDATKSDIAIFEQTSGNTTVTGRTFDLNNDLDYIEGGKLTVGNNDASSLLTVSEGTIGSGATLDITKNATINVTGGDVVVNSGDTWNGNLQISDGTVRISDIEKDNGATFTQTGGKTTIVNTGDSVTFDLNNAEDIISGGLLEIGTGGSSNKTEMKVSEGTIGKGAEVNLNKDASLDVSGGNVYFNSNDNIYGALSNSGGYIEISDINKKVGSTFTQTAGDTVILSPRFELSEQGDKISGGSLTIGSSSTSTHLTVSNGSIAEDAKVNVTSNSYLTVSGNGEISLDATDTWNGAVEVQGGTLNLDGINTKNGVLSQIKGTTNVIGTGLNLDKKEDNISGGELNIGDGTTLSDITVSKGTITKDATVNVNKAGTLNVTGSGNVALGQTSEIKGNVNVNGGTFSADSTKKDKDGVFTQSSGTVTITGSGFNLNNAKDSIGGGTFNVGDGTQASIVKMSDGTIASTATTNINANGTLEITGGKVSLGSDDTYNGTIKLGGGTLDLKAVKKGADGIFEQTDGTATITGTSFGLDNVFDKVTGGELNIGDGVTSTNVSVAGGSITSAATVNINQNATMHLDGVGNVVLDQYDILDGSINMTGGSLTLNTVDKNQQGTFTQSAGDTTIIGDGFDLNNYKDSISGGSVTIGDGTTSSSLMVSEGTVQKDARIDINNNASLKVNGGTVTIDNKDIWSGDIYVSNGSLTLDNVTDKNGALVQTKGTTDIIGTGLDLNSTFDNISGGTLNVGDGKTKSDLTVSKGTIGKDATLNLKDESALKITGGTVNFNADSTKSANSIITQTGGTTIVTGNNLDLNNERDHIQGGYFLVGTATDKSTVTVSKGTIEKDSSVLIANDSTLNISGGNVDLDGGTDSIGGNINISSGTLGLESIAKNSASTFTQTGGTTSVTGTGFSLNNVNDIVSGGTVNVGGTVAGSSLGIDRGTISSSAIVNVDKNSSINMSDGLITKGATVNLSDTSKFNMAEGIIDEKATVNLKNNASMTIEKGSITNEAQLNATNSAIINIKKGIVSDGAEINLNKEAILNIENGAIKTGAKLTAADTSVVNMKDGNITKTGVVNLEDRAIFNMENGTINDGAVLNIDDQAKVNLKGGSIDSDADITISEHAIINQSGGKLALDKTDTYNGTINLTGGSLALIGIKKNPEAVLYQTGGTTQVTGVDFDLNNYEDKILGGELLVGDTNTESILTISHGTVAKDVDITIAEQSTVELTGGKLTLDNKDHIDGNINNKEGSLTLDNATKSEYGVFTQTGGVTNVIGTGFDLNNEDDNISAGFVKVGGTTSNSDLTLSAGSISKDANVTVNKNSSLIVDGGAVTTGANVVIKDSSLLSLNNGKITDKAVVTFEDSSNMSMTDGEVSKNAILNFEDSSKFNMNGGKIKDSATVNLNDDSNMTIHQGTITDKAVVNASSESTLNVNGGIISNDAQINLDQEATMNITDGVIKTGATLTATDTTIVNMSDGNITKFGKVNVEDRAIFNMAGGTINDGAILNLDDQGKFNLLGGDVDADATITISEQAVINQSGGSLELDKNDTYNGTINHTGGSLALIGIKKNPDAVLTQTGGDTLVLGTDFDLNNLDDVLSGGSLTVGTEDKESVMTITHGKVGKDVDTTITKDSTINLTGGKLALNSKDVYDGHLNMTSGILELDSVTKDEFATFIQTNGKTTITGKGFTLNNEEDNISGGNVYVGGSVANSELNIAGGKISKDAIVKVNNNSSINMNQGAITEGATVLFKDTSGLNIQQGEISNKAELVFNDDAEMKMHNGTITSNAKIDFNDNAKFDMIKGTISNGANLNFENNAQMNMADGKITSAAILNFEEDTSFKMNSGTISDKAEINLLNNAKMDMKDGEITSEATVNMRNDSKFTMRSSTVSDNAKINMFNETDLTITDGKIATGATVTMKDYSKLNLDGGSITDEAVVNLGDRSSLKITNGIITDAAEINLNDASTLNIEKDGIVTGSAIINLDERATINQNGGDVTLNKNDKYEGTVNHTAGYLTIDELTKSKEAVFNQTGGDTLIKDTTFDLNNEDDRVSGGSLTIGTLADPATLTVTRGVIETGASTTVTKGSKLDVTGGFVALDGETDELFGALSISKGTLELNSMTKDSEGTFTQTGGTTLVKGKGFTMNNDEDIISAGVVNIGGNVANSELNMTTGTITSTAVVNIDNNSALNVNGGTVTNGAKVTAKDTSEINVGGGTVDNEAKLILTDNSKLNVSKGAVKIDAIVNLGENATLNQTGGTVVLSGTDDIVDGSIYIADGELTLTNNIVKTTTDTATFNQVGGTTNIDNSKLTLTSPASKIVGGTVNVTDGELNIDNSSQNKSDLNLKTSKFTVHTGSQYTTTGGTVDQDSIVKIENNGTFIEDGVDAFVTLDGETDKTDGHIKLADGIMTMKGVDKITTSTGTYNQTGGTLNIQDKSLLSLNEDDSVIIAGVVNVTDNSTLIVNNGKENKSDLTVADSTLTIKGNSKYTTTGGKIGKESPLTLEAGSTLKIDGEKAEVYVSGTKSKLDGNVELADGILYISDDLIKVTTVDGNYVQTGGSMTLDDSELKMTTAGSRITAGDVTLKKDSILTVNGASAITGGNLSIDDTSRIHYLTADGLSQTTSKINLATSGLVDFKNNVVTSNNINNLVVNNGLDGDGKADFEIDIIARDPKKAACDSINANSITVSTQDQKGVINISDYTLNGDVFGNGAPISKHIRLHVFNSDEIDDEIKFTSTSKEVFTPIGYYKLNASPANDGSYSFDLTRFNPQVFRGQVATASTYLNQLSINDSLFNKAQIRRYSPTYSDMFRNRTALVEGIASYDRRLHESEVWTEAFGNFETFKFNHDLDKVRNNSWGMMVGSDFGVKRLRKGWSWIPSGYVAYMGGHQTFNKVSMYENGAQIGFMSSWMKSKFVNTSILNGGIYSTDMDVANSSENTFGYFVGLANKTAYDFQINRSLKIQPALTLSYNMFGKQNYHSDYGNMQMMSGFLNGFNIAPNINFIVQKETWSAYAQLSYAWNLFGGLHGKAGDVSLPGVRLSEGYVQYALGMTKAFSDRLDMYAQATFRNLGRTGVVCQGGLNWRL